ncbi:hypothetical protein VNO77_22789 [Canavalia gladiata]|uniref:Uncharacterized protein n=1 Tax=Canavalia gladiata TaxID=3824 RepID=A0AAN9L5U2_CANGL
MNSCILGRLPLQRCCTGLLVGLGPLCVVAAVGAICAKLTFILLVHRLYSCTELKLDGKNVVICLVRFLVVVAVLCWFEQGKSHLEFDTLNWDPFSSENLMNIELTVPYVSSFAGGSTEHIQCSYR